MQLFVRTATHEHEQLTSEKYVPAHEAEAHIFWKYWRTSLVTVNYNVYSLHDRIVD